MGQKLKISTRMTSLILLSGILGFGFSADAQEAPPPPELPTQAEEAGEAQGCDESGERSNDRASAAARNPHCEDAPVVQLSSCDTNPVDGTISAVELAAHNPPLTEAEAIPIVAQHDLDFNGSIDTQAEVDSLNTVDGISCTPV